MSLKERGAITGIGETAYSRNSGKSVVALQMEASLAAIADAGQLRGGLGPRQVQGAEVAQYVPRRRRQVQEPDLHGGGVTMATARPVRAMDPYAEQFWAFTRERELRLQQCFACGKFCWPPGPTFDRCLSDDFAWSPLSGAATVLSWTTFRRSYFPEYPPPHTVVALELAEGPLFISWPVDIEPTDFREGMPLASCAGRTPPTASASTTCPSSARRPGAPELAEGRSVGSVSV